MVADACAQVDRKRYCSSGFGGDCVRAVRPDRGFIALAHPAVDSGILPSALRANAYGVIQNRSRRFCRDISTSMYKKPLLRDAAAKACFALRCDLPGEREPSA